AEEPEVTGSRRKPVEQPAEPLDVVGVEWASVQRARVGRHLSLHFWSTPVTASRSAVTPSTFGSTPCEPRTRAHATRVTGVIACRVPARTGVLPADSAFRLTRARNASGSFDAALVPRVTARTRSASGPVFEHPSSRT